MSFSINSTFKNWLILKLFKFCRNLIFPLICGRKPDLQTFVLISQLLLKEIFNDIALQFIIRYDFYALPWNSSIKIYIFLSNLKTPESFTKWRTKSKNFSLFISFCVCLNKVSTIFRKIYKLY